MWQLLKQKPKEFYWTIGIAVVISIALILLLNNLHILGRNIPTLEIGSDYFKGVLTAVLITPLIFLLPARNSVTFNLLALWSVRCLVTLGFMLYYEYTYGLDAYYYFRHAVSSIDITGGLNLYGGTDNVVVITRALAQNFSLLASYHALKVFWSFFGFLGCYIFYCAYTRSTNDESIAPLWLISLFPSVLFWSSILGKDPITLLGIALFFYSAIGLFKKASATDIILAITGLAIAGIIRTWLIVLFATPFLILFLLRSKARPFSKALIATFAGLMIAYFSNDILAALEISDSKSFIDVLNVTASSWTHGGSGQNMQSFTSGREALMFLPKGTFTALFRPLPGEVRNVFGTLSGIENMILLLGLVICFFAAKPAYRKDLFIQYAAITIFIWSLFYAYISYQNLGTAVRFKLQVLPLLLLVPVRLFHYSKEKETS